MPELKNKVISKNNAGFPDYLDFKKLRSEAIEYIGKLSGKVWTDHNVHDPGITILETLIYAIMDLGYRTNLPVEDLFARNPADTSPDNNFFHPSRILANNPLTITDYRKLLVDIPGVKNAWLEIDESTAVRFCEEAGVSLNTESIASLYSQDTCRCDRLNGLYHVYLQLRDDIDATSLEAENVKQRVKRELMSHRNLCEDYLDIRLLCKLEIGLCADIELQVGVDPAEAYRNIIFALKEFFSPSPRFYTFQQLLDKGRTVDEIYAGRPFDITQSHGFVDTEEFEQMKRKKVINLSDVYHLLFSLKEIKNVKNLGWISCCKGENEKSKPDWQFNLPEDYIPQFSASCSGIRFFQNSLPVPIDTAKLIKESYFQSISKGLYKLPSPYLEPKLPKGNYREDLATYFSIQNEFPKTYGISEGGLAADVAVSRKAKARQLQGFLLFFDQLLANYLMQLKNIRSLFALSSTGSTDRQTYFTSQLTDVPYLKELVRFATGTELTGKEGSILAYPTSRKNLQKYIDTNRLRYRGVDDHCDPCREDFPEYSFCFSTERDQAAIQLRHDLSYGGYQPVIVANTVDCYFFYIMTSATDFAMMSKAYYGSEQEAKNAATSFIYAAGNDRNFRKYLIKGNGPATERFSFDVELNMATYASYLQELVENEEQYQLRRKDFLQHLLARFAEKFADYALLSSGHLEGKELTKKLIASEEKFLSNYEDISANRGKSYDYSHRSFYTNNISGFEKRIKALAGIDGWEQKDLCNFVVEPADKEFRISIHIFNLVFVIEDKLLSEAEATASLKSAYSKLLHGPVFHTQQLADPNEYRIYFMDELGNKYMLEQFSGSKQEMDDATKHLEKAFTFSPDRSSSVRVASEVYKLYVINKAGDPIAESVNSLPDLAKAEVFQQKISKNLASHLKKDIEFTAANPGSLPDKLIQRIVDGEAEFINAKQFNYNKLVVPRLKKVQYKYSMINPEGTVQFDSILHHDTPEEAEKDFNELQLLLHDRKRYSVEPDRKKRVHKLFIRDDKQERVELIEDFSSPEKGEQKADEIFQWVRSQVLRTVISEPIPDSYDFVYVASDPYGNSASFTSNNTFNKDTQAWNAAREFHDSIHEMDIKPGAETIALKAGGIKLTKAFDKKRPEEIQKAENILYQRKEAYAHLKQADEKFIASELQQLQQNRSENFIYKLVDKNNPLAFVPRAAWKRFNNDAVALKSELLAQSAAGYNYLEIYLAGHMLKERKDRETNAKRYHYQIKCTNRFYIDNSGERKELILFESIEGFQTKEDALKAFEKKYLDILYKAMDPVEYGEQGAISLEERFQYKPDPCDMSKSIVFVPKETVTHFGGYEVRRDLSALARTYPVRKIAKDRYIFIAAQVDEVAKTTEIQWRSWKYYNTAMDAIYAFRFLLTLLKYSGNYNYKIGAGGKPQMVIREVLAISAKGFSSPAKAWGTEGVGKFICVAQTKNGFHHYWNRLNCSYSFFVACGNTGLVHPCSYETPARRNSILDKLKASANFNFYEKHVSEFPDHIILHKEKGINPKGDEDLAKIFLPKGASIQLCELFVRFFELIYDDNSYIKEKKVWSIKLMYTDNSGKLKNHIIAESLRPDLDQWEWKTELLSIACYFPIRLSERKYYLDIKLPGFNSCKSLNDKSYDCLPEPIEDECEVSCHTAWKSECCFETCTDARVFYYYAIALLKDTDNYKPVYDCNCGYYRIELHPRLNEEGFAKFLKDAEISLPASYATGEPAIGRYKYPLYHQGDNDFRCFSEIIAINPQQYVNEKMACDASKRALNLINSEGLHLVEHILLRPRCIEEKTGKYKDCNCDGLPRPCVNEDSVCHFEWQPGGEPDICEIQKTVDGEPVKKVICFTPGCDPYSFVATIALPSWPSRFRTKSGREIIEKMLRREAPAHVMLRILWMNPRELCCFEYYYKQWIDWLALKQYNNLYSTCDFLKLLFKHRYVPWDECIECIPCSPDVVKEPDCFVQEEFPCSDFNLNEQLEKLFCFGKEDWTGIDINFENCEPCLQEPAALGQLTKSANAQKKLSGTKKPEESPASKEDKEFKQKKASMMRKRHTRYTGNITDVLKHNKKNKTVEDAASFLTRTEAEPAAYDELARRIIDHKPKKNETALSKDDKVILIQTITSRYLDLIFTNGKKLDKLETLRETFKYLKSKKVGMDELFDAWQIDEIRPYEDLPDQDTIRNILNGKG